MRLQLSVATLTGTTVSDTNAVVVTVTGFISGETITVTATHTTETDTNGDPLKVEGTIDTSTTSRDATLTLDMTASLYDICSLK